MAFFRKQKNQAVVQTPGKNRIPLSQIALTGGSLRIQDLSNQLWFPAGEPILPISPLGTPPRRYPYQPMANINWADRDGQVDFMTIRNFSMYPIVRDIIETLKDQLCSQEWNFVPKPDSKRAPSESTVTQGKKDPRIEALYDFFRKPDGVQPFRQWLRGLYDDVLVIDACCYSDDTEVLTSSGWKLWGDVTQEDKLATRSSDGRFEWQIPSGIFKYSYTGEMLNFTARNTDILVTPNHNMLSGIGSSHSDKYDFITAQELSKNLSNRVMPSTSVWEAPDIVSFELAAEPTARSCRICLHPNRDEIEQVLLKPRLGKSERKSLVERFGVKVQALHRHKKNHLGKAFSGTQTETRKFKVSGDDFCALMGAYLSEGSLVTKRNQVVITQLKKSKGFVPFTELLTKVFGKYSVEGNNLCVRNAPFTRYLRQFGHAKNKFVPDLIKNASAKQIKIFIEYFVLGDGYFKSNSDSEVKGITTSSKKLADDFQELFQKIGMSASVRESKLRSSVIQGRKIKESRAFQVYVRVTPNILYRTCSSVHYSGNVYCAEVPNHTLYVRRNGYPAWCGNSIWKQRDTTGKLCSLVQIDGAQVFPLIDETGMQPASQPYQKMLVQTSLEKASKDYIAQKQAYDQKGGSPAWQLTPYGFPAQEMTDQEMIYALYNRLSYRRYGFSKTEQCLAYIALSLGRLDFQAAFYRSGNMPEGLAFLPSDVPPSKVEEMNQYLDTVLSGNLQQRRKIIFLPSSGSDNKTQIVFPKLNEQVLKDEFDEWLARVLCHNFGVNPQGFIKQVNRGESKEAGQAQQNEGVRPLLNWTKDLLDTIIQEDFGYPDIEAAVSLQTQMDEQTTTGVIVSQLTNGVISLDEARDRLGYETIGEPWSMTPMVKTATGVVPYSSGLAVIDPTMPQGPTTPSRPVGSGPTGSNSARSNTNPLAGGRPTAVTPRTRASSVPKPVKPSRSGDINIAADKPRGADNVNHPGVPRKGLDMIWLDEEVLLRKATDTSWTSAVEKADIPTVYFVRHGKTHSNVEQGPDSALESKIHGWINDPLDAEGQAEALQVAQEFKNVPVSVIYTSDMQRAEAVAEAIHGVTNAPVIPLIALRSWNMGNLQGQEVANVLPQVEHYQLNPSAVVPGGESFNSFFNREKSIVDAILEEAKTSPSSIVVVTHSRVILSLPTIIAGGSENGINQFGGPKPTGIMRAQFINGQWQLDQLPPATTLSGKVQGITMGKPYNSTSQVPDYVPEDKKKQWMDVWNSVHDKGGSEASAFAQANAVAGPSHKAKSSDSIYHAKPNQQISATVGIKDGKTHLQSIIFHPKENWTKDEVHEWLTTHRKKDDIQETGDSYRARQVDPAQFDEIRTIPFTADAFKSLHKDNRNAWPEPTDPKQQIDPQVVPTSAFMQPSRLTPASKRAKAKLQDEFEKLFAKLRDKFKSANKVAKAGPQEADDTPKSDLDLETYENQIWSMIDPEFTLLFPGLAAALADAAQSGVDLGVQDLGMTMVLDNENTAAKEYAQDRAAEMIGKRLVNGELVDNPNAEWAITDATRKKIKSIIANAFQEGNSIPEIKDMVQKALAEGGNGIFTDWRAAMIAKTEVSHAQMGSQLEIWKTSDQHLLLKWLAIGGDPCIFCMMNDGEVREIGKAFTSGYHSAADSHPNCECAVIAVTAANPEAVTSNKKVETGDLAKMKQEQQDCVYVMRHASTALDNQHRSDGWLDLPLSDRGNQQVVDTMSKNLQQLPITKIFCAPLRRTEATAHILQSGMVSHPQVKVEPDLMTWNLGSLSGGKKKPNKEVVNDLLMNPDKKAPDGGESYNQFCKRFDREMKKIFARSKTKGPFLVILSGSNLRRLGEVLKDNRNFMNVDEAGLVRISREDGKWVPEVISGSKDTQETTDEDS